MNLNHSSLDNTENRFSSDNSNRDKLDKKDKDAASAFQKQLLRKGEEQRNQNLTKQDKPSEKKQATSPFHLGQEKKQERPKEKMSLTSKESTNPPPNKSLDTSDEELEDKPKSFDDETIEEEAKEKGQNSLEESPETNRKSPFDLAKPQKPISAKPPKPELASTQKNSLKAEDEIYNLKEESQKGSITETEKKEKDSSSGQPQTSSQQITLQDAKQIIINNPNTEVSVPRVQAKDLSQFIEKMYVFVDTSGTTETNLVLKSQDGTLTTLKVIQENNQLIIEMSSTDPQLVNKVLAQSGELADTIQANIKKIENAKNSTNRITKVSINCTHTTSLKSQNRSDTPTSQGPKNSGQGDDLSL